MDHIPFSEDFSINSVESEEDLAINHIKKIEIKNLDALNQNNPKDHPIDN